MNLEKQKFTCKDFEKAKISKIYFGCKKLKAFCIILHIILKTK